VARDSASVIAWEECYAPVFEVDQYGNLIAPKRTADAS